MKNRYKIALVSLAVSSTLLFGCKPNSDNMKQAMTPTVETVTLAETQITPYHTFIGRTEAINDVDIMPRVGGELTAIHFKDGDMVEKGQLLFSIDDRPYKAALEFARASLTKANAQLVKATRDAARAQRLIRNKSVSEQYYDDAIAIQAQAIASVEEAKANLESARLDLEFTAIRAPFAGRVGFSSFRVGDRISTIQVTPLVSITQINPIHFKFDVDEKLYRRVRNAIDVAHRNDDKLDVDLTLTLSDGSIYPNPGEIYAVGNKIDEETGAIKAEAEFKNPIYSLMPGEYGNLTIKLRNKAINGLLIPSSAIQQDQAGDYVMVVGQDNILSRRNIELGQPYGVNRAVISGVSANEKVVVNGLQKVRPGIKVKENDQKIN